MAPNVESVVYVVKYVKLKSVKIYIREKNTQALEESGGIIIGVRTALRPNLNAWRAIIHEYDPQTHTHTHMLRWLYMPTSFSALGTFSYKPQVFARNGFCSKRGSNRAFHDRTVFVITSQFWVEADTDDSSDPCQEAHSGSVPLFEHVTFLVFAQQTCRVVCVRVRNSSARVMSFRPG